MKNCEYRLSKAAEVEKVIAEAASGYLIETMIQKLEKEELSKIHEKKLKAINRMASVIDDEMQSN